MYSIERIVHNVNFKRRYPDGLTALKANYLLLQFAVSMVSSFGVLFIFHLGGDLFRGLFFVLSFFVAQRVFVGVFIPLVAHSISKYGYRRNMLVGLALFGVKLLLLTLVNSNNLMLLLPIAVAGGVSTAAYYLAFHALFLDDNDDSRIGEQMGAIQMLGRLAGVVSPFIAGILVDSFGFSVMFIVAIGVLLISSYPLMIMKHHKKHTGVYSTGHAWDFIRRKPKIAISMFAWSFTDGIQVFYWPILLFILLKSYTSFGIVGSVVMIVNSFSVYLIGKAYDKRQLKATFETSSVLVSVTWAARFLSTTGGTAVVSELFNRIFSPLWWTKIRRQELVEGEKIDSLVFGVAHEYIVTFAYIFALILGYTILLAANGAWGWLALPTIIATLVTAIILKDD